MIRVGITGHRFLSEQCRIQESIAQAYHFLKSQYPGENLQILSCLAEGADRMVASYFLTQNNTRLLAVLPMHTEEYEKDFQSLGSREEFRSLLNQADQVVELASHGSRNLDYLRAGEYVLSQSDVMIAVWDGKPAQGMGGVGAITAQAQQKQVPLIWIHAGNRLPGTEQPTSLGEEQGAVTFKNFSKSSA